MGQVIDAERFFYSLFGKLWIFDSNILNPCIEN